MNRRSENNPFEIRQGDEARLRRWAESGTPRQSLRAKIVLESATGQSAETVGEVLGIAPVTVYKWRGRYRSAGCEGLSDLPRSGQPRKLSPERVAQIVDMTVDQVPERHVRWSVRKLARAAGVTEHQIRSIWAEHDLSPHQSVPVGPMADAGLDPADVDLLGLLIAPPRCYALLGVDHDAQRSTRSEVRGLRRRGGQTVRDLRAGPDTLLSAWDRAARLREDGSIDRDRDAALDSFAEQILPHAARCSLHAIASSPAAASALAARLPATPPARIHAMPTIASWAEELEQWMRQKEARMRWNGEPSSVEEARACLRGFIATTQPGEGAVLSWLAMPAEAMRQRPRALG
ncbi:MAG: helix-turn-helix domain-containing protein [Myxococcales bacterium]|jgi:transposase